MLAPNGRHPDGSDRFYQGSIATHGLHILAIADSDNARQTVPLTEIVGDQRLVMLPGWRGGDGGRAVRARLRAPLPASRHDAGQPARRLALAGARLVDRHVEVGRVHVLEVLVDALER